MSRLEEDDLFSFLNTYLLSTIETTEPSDEQIFAIYQETQDRLYPTKNDSIHVRNKSERAYLKKLRRSIEHFYPWLRMDEKIRAIQASYHRAKNIDIVISPESPPEGVVLLKNAKENRTDQVFEWRYFTPRAEEQDSDSDSPTANERIEELLIHRKPPLIVLLVHLWHFEKKLDSSTSVRIIMLNTDPKTGQKVPIVRQSAISLSACIEGLR
jgi:hypothetical protein